MIRWGDSPVEEVNESDTKTSDTRGESGESVGSGPCGKVERTQDSRIRTRSTGEE